VRSCAVAGASDRGPLLAVPVADREGSHRSRTLAVPLSDAVNVTDIDELPNRGGCGLNNLGRAVSAGFGMIIRVLFSALYACAVPLLIVGEFGLWRSVMRPGDIR
jgi:hypothetical protein